jgi:hypothetical protein
VCTCPRPSVIWPWRADILGTGIRVEAGHLRADKGSATSFAPGIAQ